MLAPSISALADGLGTPLYVYDGTAIAALVERCSRELKYRPRRLLYSAKANPAVGIAALLRRHGCGLDACSPGDLRLAELAGYTWEEISYTGFGSTDDELAAAATAAGALVLDDIGEIERLARLGVQRPIGLRVNPGITAGFHAHVVAGTAQAKFGVAIGDLDEAVAVASAAGLEVQGLHAHLGSDVLEAAPHVELLELLAELAERVSTVAWVNLGGGYGTPRRGEQRPFPWSDLDRAAHRLLVLADGRRLELRLEPGGHLLMNAGVVVGRVLAVKRGDPERLPTVVTDVATNQLVSVLLYDAHHAVHLVGRECDASSRRAFRIVGNLMQAGDVLATKVELPAVVPGDLLAFGHAGAYAASRATTFNQRPRAAEVLLDGDRAILLRRAETVEDLFAREEGRLIEPSGT